MKKPGNTIILSTPEEILPLIVEAIRIVEQDKKDNAAENASKKFLTPKDIEQEFGIHQKILAYWRSEGIGPHYTSIGRRVYYERIDIENFFTSGKVQTTGCVDR